MTKFRTEAAVIDRIGFKRWAMAALFLCFCGLPAFADAAPSRSARLTFTEGSVRIARADSPADGNAGDQAQLNMPLLEGQTVMTGDNGQAEVEFEDGSLARLTPNTALNLTRLALEGGSSFNTQLSLGRGLAYFELRAAPRLSYTVMAGTYRIIPTENTTFRIMLDQPPAVIAMLDGAAHVERTGSYGVDLGAGESFRADASEPGRYFLTQEVTSDSWDQWNESRDQMAADAASQNTGARDSFAGAQGYGWSDLDANGRWYDVAGQGRVWQPNGGDTEDFDPYGNGSWVWSGNAGYVWASSYSWGWTPFRCGGWSYWNNFGWGWTPNAACGGFGYAGYSGYGGGFGGRGGGRGPLNIVLPPLHYRDHRPPPPGRGDIHPIVSVHEGPQGVRGIVASSGDHPVRTIGGVVARPLMPVGAGYTARGGSAVGSSLRRDYPVDRATHSPIMGIQAGQAVERRGLVSGARQGTEQPRGFTNGVNSGYTNGAASGYRNGAAGGYTNGAANGYTNGAASGYTNGISVGQRPGGLPPPAQRVMPPPDMRTGRYSGNDGQPRTNGMVPPRGAQGAEGQGYQRMQAPQHAGPSMQVQQAPRMSAPPQQQMSRPSMPAPSAPMSRPAPSGPSGGPSKK